jgi:ENTH domain-containing protein
MADYCVSFYSPTDFYEIMDMLDKRLNDKGKNWRHVLKSLKVLDYCLHEGSEMVVTWARKNVYIIKTLREFQYVDDEDKDVGQNGGSHGTPNSMLKMKTTLMEYSQCEFLPRNLPLSFSTKTD